MKLGRLRSYTLIVVLTTSIASLCVNCIYTMSIGEKFSDENIKDFSISEQLHDASNMHVRVKRQIMQLTIIEYNATIHDLGNKTFLVKLLVPDNFDVERLEEFKKSINVVFNGTGVTVIFEFVFTNETTAISSDATIISTTQLPNLTTNITETTSETDATSSTENTNDVITVSTTEIPTISSDATEINTTQLPNLTTNIIETTPTPETDATSSTESTNDVITEETDGTPTIDSQSTETVSETTSNENASPSAKTVVVSETITMTATEEFTTTVPETTSANNASTSVETLVTSDAFTMTITVNSSNEEFTSTEETDGTPTIDSQSTETVTDKETNTSSSATAAGHLSRSGLSDEATGGIVVGSVAGFLLIALTVLLIVKYTNCRSYSYKMKNNNFDDLYKPENYTQEEEVAGVP